jgi:hypothetical protein
MRQILMIPMIATALALPLGSANAQYYSPDVVARCSQAAGQFKFEGYPAERNRDMMTMACEANGGTIPGASQNPTTEKPVSLPRHRSTR